MLSVENSAARAFYETEAIRGGWSVRQLDRQISTKFYDRTAPSKNMAAMFKKGSQRQEIESPAAEEEVKDPCVLEFLGLKDEYSESNLEDSAVAKYALEGLSTKVLGAEYKLALRGEKQLAREVDQGRKALLSPPDRVPN